ncbi:helicase [Aureococcus anophagefferens]|nr:helicase [Aureococcus anophagefferens]
MELRKCVNHPLLLAGVRDASREALQDALLAETGAGAVAPAAFEAAAAERLLVAGSGKMVFLDKLLPRLRSEGRKVLVFSQFVRVLGLVAELCAHRGYDAEALTGATPAADRQRAIDRFNASPDAFVFLLSTRAGGVGINLCAADTVVIYDSDWNPQNDVQAMARCHRLGQTRDVAVYRLVARKSFEGHMLEAAARLGLSGPRAAGDAVDVDDPDFWAKAMPHMVTPELVAARLDADVGAAAAASPTALRASARRSSAEPPATSTTRARPRTSRSCFAAPSTTASPPLSGAGPRTAWFHRPAASPRASASRSATATRSPTAAATPFFFRTRPSHAGGPPPPPTLRGARAALFCVCRTPEDPGALYVACDGCAGWFHRPASASTTPTSALGGFLPGLRAGPPAEAPPALGAIAVGRGRSGPGEKRATKRRSGACLASGP